MGFELAKMASTKLARRQMVGAMVSETTKNPRFKEAVRATRQRVVTNNHKV